jgi:arylsulfatase A-like enzyme
MPTLLGELGLSDPDNLNPGSPGSNVSSILHGDSLAARDAVFFEMETTRVIRTPSWKYIHRPDGPFELYDLEKDPHERVNLYGQPGHDERIASLKKRLDEFFDQHADPKYDLYHGGGSKTHLLTKPEKERIVPVQRSLREEASREGAK